MPRACDCSAPVFPDRATIQQKSEAAGNPIEDFSGTPFKSGMPCNITTVTGEETYRGRQLEAHISHVVEMRWFDGVLPTMRLSVTGGIYKDRVLNIRYVKPVRKPGKMPMQWLYCEELAATS